MKLFSLYKIILFTILLLPMHSLLAQPPTQADIDRMMKQAQDQMKKMGGDTSSERVLKNLDAQQKQVREAMNNRPQNGTAASTSLYPDPSEYGNVDNWKFPPKNTALLSSLPKRSLTKTELVSFLNEVYKQLSKKLPPAVVSSVQSLSAKYGNDGNKMGDAAIMGWYTNYREEALLLIVKAAANNPDNSNLLNNCAAVLNMGGIEQIAIPILKYVLQSYPNDPMVLNNTGQAYAGLGDIDTAMYYLGRCLKIEPANPEANNTAGQVEATRGNNDKAISYFQEAIKAAYSKPAELKLRKIKTDSRIGPFVKPRVNVPEYFNQFKYQYPAQCTSTENAEQARADYAAFKATLGNQLSRYAGKEVALHQKYAQLIMAKPGGGKLVKGSFMSQPFAELCSIMARDLLADYMKEMAEWVPQGKKGKIFMEKMESLEREYQKKHGVIKKGFDDREKEAIRLNCCGEGNTSCCIPDGEECKAFTALANEYLPQFAAVMEDWQEKFLLVPKKYFDDLIYWSYLAFHNVPFGTDFNSAPNDDFYRMQSFYPLVNSYLEMMLTLANTRIIEPCTTHPLNSTKDSTSIPEPDCPLDVTIPFIIGKIQLNCEKFSFSGGEGVVFGYEKIFKTKQSTLSVGIGAKLELGAKLGPLKGGMSAGMDESLYITFDGNNGFSDAGVKFTAKAVAGANAGGVIKRSAGTDVGYTFGINSGCNFSEGPFKGMIGPAPEVQQNRNVKIYKGN